MNVNPEYHPKIIGKAGSVVKKIREEFGVQINLPKRGDPDESTITVIGYEEKAIAAKEAIMAIVNQLVSKSLDIGSIYNNIISFLLKKH